VVKNLWDINEPLPLKRRGVACTAYHHLGDRGIFSSTCPCWQSAPWECLWGQEMASGSSASVRSRVFGEHAVVGPRDRLRVIFGDQYPGRLRSGARGTQWRTPSGCVTYLGGEDGSFGDRSQTYLLVRRLASASATRWVAMLPCAETSSRLRRVW
jgi:hypothetical protein